MQVLHILLLIFIISCAVSVSLTKNLLTYSPYSYIEIATYLGFSSQSHMGKVFKKYTDMTLRQYRERYGREQIQERRKAELISNE